ncbi:MAG: hypothetical protein AB8G96_03740 [Phycisphaerales bacterium]
MSRRGSPDQRLVRALIRGDADAARKALEAGADVHLAPTPEFPLINAACAEGKAEIVDAMLEHGLKWDEKTKQARICWSLAAALRHKDVCAVLEKHGVKPKLMDRLMLPLMRFKLKQERALHGQGTD